MTTPDFTTARPPEFLRPAIEEPIVGLTGQTVGDFWRWAYPDLLSNTVRPLLAEFIVAVTLGVQSKPRVEWDAVDLRYDGKRIEVKSAAYLQSWPQVRLSMILFGTAEKRPWDGDTNIMGDKAVRSADCYVFCLYTEKQQKDAVLVLDLHRWEFYVVPTWVLNERLGAQKGVSLSTISGMTKPVPHLELKAAVNHALTADAWIVGGKELVRNSVVPIASGLAL